MKQHKLHIALALASAIGLSACGGSSTDHTMAHTNPPAPKQTEQPNQTKPNQTKPNQPNQTTLILTVQANLNQLIPNQAAQPCKTS